jgi:amino-acid N-acetyltransferase
MAASVVESALAADLVPILALLETSGLPTSDLEAGEAEFVVMRDEGTVVAAGALQRFGSTALLRSVVVADHQRSRGLGQQVLRELERRARRQNIGQLVLLTESASEFFLRAGYRTLARGAAPAELQQSAEFQSLCPSSATCMSKALS